MCTLFCRQRQDTTNKGNAGNRDQVVLGNTDPQATTLTQECCDKVEGLMMGKSWKNYFAPES